MSVSSNLMFLLVQGIVFGTIGCLVAKLTEKREYKTPLPIPPPTKKQLEASVRSENCIFVSSTSI